MKVMRKLVLIFILAALSPLICGATEDGDKRFGYGFGDNWFIEADGGINTIFNMNSFGRVEPAAALRFGKWFTPGVGFRIGLQGLRNAPNGTETGWFSGYNPFHFYHLDGDLMLNVFNLFKYNENRFWDVCPFVRVAGIYTAANDGGHVELGGGAGIHNGLRLGKRVDLAIDIAAVAGREKAWRERGSVLAFPSVTAGIVVKLGKVGFKNRTEKEYVYQPVYVDRVRVDTVKVAQVDSGLIKQMREEPLTLFFDLDQTVLTQREIDHLEFYAKYVLTPDSVVLLTGSADKETGNPKHNQWLSEQRNAYVKDILISVYKLKPENIQEIANGDRKNEFRTKEMNRCVTISFIK